MPTEEQLKIIEEIKNGRTDLDGVDLSGCDLRGIFNPEKYYDLSEANLSYSDLRGTKFEVTLTDASLCYAKLRHCLFNGEVTNVDFTGADLSYCDFVESYLAGSNFTDAVFVQDYEEDENTGEINHFEWVMTKRFKNSKE